MPIFFGMDFGVFLPKLPAMCYNKKHSNSNSKSKGR